MKGKDLQLDHFFDQYCDAFNAALHGEDDIQETAALFTSCFVATCPAGITCGQNNEDFSEALKKGLRVLPNDRNGGNGNPMEKDNDTG